MQTGKGFLDQGFWSVIGLTCSCMYMDVRARARTHTHTHTHTHMCRHTLKIIFFEASWESLWVSSLSCHMYLMEWFYPLQASLSDHLKKKTLLPSRLGEILWGSCILQHLMVTRNVFFFNSANVPKGTPKMMSKQKTDVSLLWVKTQLHGHLSWLFFGWVLGVNKQKRVNSGKPLGTFIIISWWSVCWKGMLVSGVEPACSLLIPSTSANTFMWTNHYGLIIVT